MPDYDLNLPLLRELVEAHGAPGDEGSLREIVRRELSHLANVTTDAMGSVIAHQPGTGGKRIMIAAHMDEIGFVVKHVDSKGFLRLAPLGGWDPRQMNSQRVKVRGREGLVSGVLMHGTKPSHQLSDAEKGAAQKLPDFFVDLGLTPEEVNAKVRVGDRVTMDRPLAQTGELLTSKAMDDRVGVFVMLEALRKVGEHSAEIFAVATSQEEIGLRGAVAAGGSVKPDVVIALDITLANDIPGIPEADVCTKLGGGTAIKILDSSLICHPKVVEHFVRIGERDGIPFQMEVLTGGGTDAGGVQRQNGGIPAFTLSIPTRYVHTVNETVHPKDVRASIDILAAYLREAGDADYSF